MGTKRGIDYTNMAKIQATAKELLSRYNNEGHKYTKEMLEIEFQKRTGLRREITAIRRYSEGKF